jgi:hypothetical protein
MIQFPRHFLCLIWKVYIKADNKRSLNDLQLLSSPECVKCNIDKQLCDIVTESDVKLKRLSVCCNTLYNSGVEEVRGIIDATARGSSTPSNMTRALMLDIYSRGGLVTKEDATESWLFHDQGCLDAPKALNSPIHEFTDRLIASI